MARRIDDGDLEREGAPGRTSRRLARLASICTAPSTLIVAVAVAALAAAIAIVPASQPLPRPVTTPSAAASGSYGDGSAGNADSGHPGSRNTDSRPTAGAPVARTPVGASTTVPVAIGHAATIAPVVTSGTAAPAPGVSLTLPDLKALGLPSIPPITLPINLPAVLGAVTAPLNNHGGPTTTVPLVSGLLNQLTKNVKL